MDLKTILIFIFVIFVFPSLIIKIETGKDEREKRFLTGLVKKSKYIYYKEFETNWINKGIDDNGFKYREQPGCYIITVYDIKVDENEEINFKNIDFNNYENIYVGQSIHVMQRVHNHFTGSGKGDVYADIKYGKAVFVRIIPCEEERLNDMEKELINMFNATDSYNNTIGGAKNRILEK